MGKGKGKGGSYDDDEWSFCQWFGVVLGIFAGFLLLIVFITLLALSLQKVNEGEQAIRYDEISNTLYDQILEPKIHALNPDSRLIRYPTKYEDSNIEMICRTHDGAEIQLSITFQFNYDSSKLIDSFLTIGEKEDNDRYMNYYARAAIYETCSHHDAVNFTEARGLIEFDMSNSVSAVMNKTNTHMGQFQLRNFIYPEAFQVAVNSKQQTRQRIEVVRRERNATITAAETELIQSQQRVEIQINDANAEAERLLREADSAVQTILAQWNQTILATDAEINNLDLTFEEYIDYLNKLIIGSAHRGIIQIA